MYVVAYSPYQSISKLIVYKGASVTGLCCVYVEGNLLTMAFQFVTVAAAATVQDSLRIGKESPIIIIKQKNV